ncbi:MAG: DNA polymerase ligase N-terminal domain-containing protein [Balneolaceae bacterium]|nr:DNA polymerase ligase N-terminal domain-containing protein [Balneolaceae bacterium]MDR9407948.1 DNA polymerase ligase N-terminal domain-containing protein [Balneolaceae bacterium]
MSSRKSYMEKREPDETPEPVSFDKQKANGNEPIFVIQKHDATNLHYDFRLEIDGTLKSWVIPKGPLTDPSERRLAVPVEDHPIEYAEFEGVIPKDQYGAGTVMIWDRGTYRNLKKSENRELTVEKSYDKGQIEVFLEGEKISGGYALFKTNSKDENWLLVKMDDEYADARRNPLSTENKSVKSGRTLQEIAKQES